jgi:MOSC domain-containing protein YiiM
MSAAFGSGSVVAVSMSPEHRFSKQVRQCIRLLKGLGVEGDAHSGTTVKHRSRVRKDPTQPNLRQVHLLHRELIDELNLAGFCLAPGAIGENILTQGIQLLRLPRGSRLHIGATAIIEITGLRDPCRQLNDYRPSLMATVLDRDEQGNLIRKAGIMGIVHSGGEVCAGDTIRVDLPEEPHQPLDRV